MVDLARAAIVVSAVGEQVAAAPSSRQQRGRPGSSLTITTIDGNAETNLLAVRRAEKQVQGNPRLTTQWARGKRCRITSSQASCAVNTPPGHSPRNMSCNCGSATLANGAVQQKYTPKNCLKFCRRTWDACRRVRCLAQCTRATDIALV